LLEMIQERRAMREELAALTTDAHHVAIGEVISDRARPRLR
jgi:hypothetical protein